MCPRPNNDRRHFLRKQAVTPYLIVVPQLSSQQKGLRALRSRDGAQLSHHHDRHYSPSILLSRSTIKQLRSAHCQPR